MSFKAFVMSLFSVSVPKAYLEVLAYLGWCLAMEGKITHYVNMVHGTYNSYLKVKIVLVVNECSLLSIMQMTLLDACKLGF